MTSAAEALGVDPQLLDDLPVRERRVLELRFGLRGETPTTCEDVAAIFTITREQVREIEAQALARLREAVVGIPWEEAVSRLRHAEGSWLTLDAPIDAVVYARRSDPEASGTWTTSIAYLCPAAPVGTVLEVRDKLEEPEPLWRHVPKEEGDGGPPDAVRA